MLKAILLGVLIVAAAPAAFAIEDTPANRRTEAQRYVQTVDIKSFWEQWAVGIVGNVPQDRRQEALERLLKVDLGRIRSLMVEACVKVYTADELSGMAKFYSSPVGRAVLAKTPEYDKALLPGIQQEVQRALGGK
jgi:hypothetical protein